VCLLFSSCVNPEVLSADLTEEEAIKLVIA
jgi:hypothetical protein